MTESTQDLKVEARSSLPGIIVPPLLGLGTVSAVAALLTGGQTAALLSIAGLGSASLFAIADALRRK